MINLSEIDMVVLKRNDVGDATHTDGHYSFYVGKDKNYFFSSRYKAWRGTWKNVDILKPIEKKEMKEYLDKQQDGTYKLIKADGGCIDRDWIEVPEGADSFRENLRFYNKDGSKFYSSCNYWENSTTDNTIKLIWQRHTQPEELPFMDSLNDQYAEIEQVRKHRHYFKDVLNIAEIDVYAVLKLFDVTDPCLQHIVKKALCAGKRGHKDMMEDLQNIVDTAIRAVELNA